MTRQQGFTLIEAIMVMLILSIGAVAILSQFSQAPRAWFIDEDLQIATQLVQEGAETLLAARRTNGYASIALGTVNDTLTGAYAAYGRSVAITSFSGDPCPAATCKQAVVSVTRAGNALASATFLLADY